MAQVVQARCPGCKSILRIPADWVGQSVRCKHCGVVLQAKVKRSGGQTPLSDEVTDPIATPKRRPIPTAAILPEVTDTPPPLPPEVPESKDVVRQPDDSPSPFLPPDQGPIIRTPHRRRSGAKTWMKIAAVLLLLGAVYFLFQRLRTQGYLDSGARTAAVVPPDRPSEPPPSALDPTRTLTGGAFPRRLLSICVSNYLYANPVGYGEGEANTHAVVERLARAWHVPPGQVIELSDATPPPMTGAPASRRKGADSRKPPETSSDVTPVAPLKPVIEKAIADFLDNSRPQDRVALLFVGHAVEVDDQPYLVPLEGELTEKDTLIPLSWLYDRLEKCKARQKLLILDVCRFNPGRGLERPGSGPMDAKLDAALQKPPAGVQVWSACSAEQQSYEFENGIFLGSVLAALKENTQKRIQHPPDPLPVDALVEPVRKQTEEEVAAALKVKQTPRLAGLAPAEGAQPDPNEPPPPKVVFELPPPPGGAAPKEEIKRILEEIDLPPVRQQQAATSSFQIETLLPFSAEKLQAYRPDYNSYGQLLAEVKAKKDEPAYALRAAVLEAVDLLRKAPREMRLQENISGNLNDKIKAEYRKLQEAPAKVLGKLMDSLDRMRKVGQARDQETSKRWQAHYDFVLAELLARIAYVEEYNLMLGKIRKDELPPLEGSQTGYHLASREKLQSGKDVRDLAAESKKILAKLAREHAGTPWEVLAKRERLTALGLEWQPIR